eukprot:CAMPEP_0119155748 /NCGR_PEP_ID=MMETSP1310-20130426/51905_1 /TAXON_ID=464262 /ORGANISM="Genus nov. species nov., Strain RCC2339" /LENGTH=349 /DNA_ID=CAMNT_0007148353 /DNA_START=1 /DNA_END=1050 /DNA_ORIENTATION=+
MAMILVVVVVAGMVVGANTCVTTNHEVEDCPPVTYEDYYGTCDPGVGMNVTIDWSTARAALSMYTTPQEVREANEAFWREIRGRLVPKLLGAGLITNDSDVPVTLYYGTERDYYYDFPMLTDGNMLFGQFCGYPRIITLEHRLQLDLLGAPVHGNSCKEGISRPCYDSVFVCRSDDTSITDLASLRGKRIAFNEIRSNSGYNLPRRTMAGMVSPDQPYFFSTVIPTGSHSGSLLAVQRGEADVAPIDSITYELWQRNGPNITAGTRIMGRSSVQGVAPPYLISRYFGPHVRRLVQESLLETVADVKSPVMESVRRILDLQAVEPVNDTMYLELSSFATESAQAGYPTLE